jgi:N-hydroxyarylamine O-acetyltransferase
MVARTGEGWRRTLNNGSFAIHRIGRETERRQVADVDELMDLLRNEFDIRVPREVTLRRVIERLIQQP